MSTQSSDFTTIPLYITHPFQNVRLLEVPDEVLDIIVNSRQALFLKSTPVLEQQTLADPVGKEGNLHLCADEKTWLVKQVSTSNSVYLTRTNKETPEQDGDTAMNDDDDRNGPPTLEYPGIVAFSKPSSVLELLPIPDSSYATTVQGHLDRLIPTIGTANEVSIEHSQFSLQDLYDHIPAPRSTIEKTLAQRCVFELPWKISKTNQTDPDNVSTKGNIHSETPSSSPSRAYTPTPQLLLDTWKQIVDAATLSETQINGRLEPDLLLPTFGTDKQTPTDETQDVHQAVARAMFMPKGYFEILGLITKARNADDTADGISAIDTARWVGNILLKVEGQRDKQEFETMWEDLVPAAWVKYCSVEVLSPSCEVSEGAGTEIISWRTFVLSNAVQEVDGGWGTALAETNGQKVLAGKVKRKWHEKFAAQRNVKRE